MDKSEIERAEKLARKARKRERLKTKRASTDESSELMVRSETRKGILSYYGSGIWQGNLKRNANESRLMIVDCSDLGGSSHIALIQKTGIGVY